MIKNILQEGFILKSRGYYKHAIESFYKALEIDNFSEELMLEIADCYYLLQDEERALNYIEQVIATNPTHIGALKFLMNIFVSKNAWEEAEQTAKNIYCITKEVNDLAKVFELLNKQGRYEEIFEYQVEFLTPEFLYEKAYAQMFLNNFGEAEVLINQALELNSCDKNLILKCKILYKMNKKDECVNLLREISIDETNSDILNFVGLVKQYECDFGQAVKYFQEAVRLNSNNAEYHYNCASTYFKLGEKQLAKKYYNLAVTLEPENQNYHFALANLYYSEKHYKRALEELDYDFFEARLLKSIILFDSGYLAVAKKEFESLIEEQPDNELVQTYLGKVREELSI